MGGRDGCAYLRSKAAKARRESEYQRKRAERLEDENARLRELVRAMVGCGTRYHCIRGGCPLFDVRCEDMCSMDARLGEIGA